MRTKFLVERFLPVKTSNLHIALMRDLCLCYERGEDFAGGYLNIEKLPIVDEFSHLFKDNCEMILRSVDKSSMTVLAKCYAGWKEEKKIYVFSKSLTKALGETKAEISYKYLPDEFSSFFELEGLTESGKKILGTFVDIGQGKLSVAQVNEKFEVFHHNYPIGECETLEELIEKYASSFKMHWTQGVERKATEGEATELIRQFKIAVNASVFAIYNKEAEIELNSFQGNANAIETQKKIYAELPFKYFGKDFVLPKTFTVDSTVVSGHFRWIRCNEGRKDVRHVYIEPHIRNYKHEN